MHCITIQDIIIFYEKYGTYNPNYPSLILVHGWSTDHFIWEEFIRYYSPHTVIWALDLPGHGQSNCPHIDYTISLLGEIVNKFIKQLQIEKPLLCGHSMGGFAILQYEIAHPGNSVGLVCFATTPFFGKVPKQFRKFLKPLVNSFLNYAFNTSLPLIGHLPYHITYRECRHRTDEISCLECQEICKDKFAIESFLTNLILNYDLRPWLHTIAVPVLTIVGTKDLMRLFLPFFKKIPNLSIKIIPEADHELIVTHAPILFKLVENFRRKEI